MAYEKYTWFIVNGHRIRYKLKARERLKNKTHTCVNCAVRYTKLMGKFTTTMLKHIKNNVVIRFRKNVDIYFLIYLI